MSWVVQSYVRSFADAPVPVTPSTSAPAAPASAEESKKSTLFQMPKWMRNLMPGGSRDDPAPGAASGSREAGKTSDDKEKQMQQERKRQIDMLKSLSQGTVDGYQAYIQQQIMQQDEPKPLQPPVPMWHKDYKRFMDQRRVQYIRVRQHNEICKSMEEADKRRVQTEGGAVLKDVAFLNKVAQYAVNSKNPDVPYTAWEVGDCIWSLLTLKRSTRRLLACYDRNEPNWQPPDDPDKTEKLYLEIEQEEARDWYGRALLKRNPAECTLSGGITYAKPYVTCQTTGLPWKYCCGNQPMPIKQAVEMMVEEEGIGPTSERANFIGKVVNGYIANPPALKAGGSKTAAGDGSITPLPPRDSKDPLHKDAYEQAGYKERRLVTHKRGPKLNHLLGPPEGAPRQVEHEWLMRETTRLQMKPKFKRTL
eukprot:CAMPEP_0202860242 /NCGR_PEP_ID=MMETSP1391-20130828/2029_1 /ASSEMBLY_ACC=CAM_ASM_000867 /TAXON_ID=1034604 /ORGANISM="Chlamydomonas leiostraca, Strain SAG 11-49" /LENGTH=420 /DNA_ID=CAMNT_0049539383 /DNA_START=122 /DNA_END=1384 /DNA_ORIENTATION=-